MGTNDCSCNKPSLPLGTSVPKPQTQPSGGLAAQTQSYTLQLPNGGSQKFTGSRLEAQAQAVRIGASIQF
jgi:hypothetical protein